MRVAVAAEVTCPSQQSIRVCSIDTENARVAKQAPAETSCLGKAVLHAAQSDAVRMADKMLLAHTIDLLPQGSAGGRLERPPRELTV
ncbi:hypothetical protein FPY71_06915 [Aureimonas fodinaquatilis]|uniref:Uncharacterized protein n=1 Tax=Aureimonas fodinaquatilis TaxID=2565783 RepID=A0A5B0DWL2_9HYPH|nr:hypothetical protein [Aureimonas fodinaquatilis]KAA0970255.1 hypothetical protein FPY71_06915 [Aureimonas fodinaquatilis]